MNTLRHHRLIALFALLTGSWLQGTALHGQSQDVYAKPQGYVLPAKRAVPAAKMYQLLQVQVDTKPLKRKMPIETFFQTLHKGLPKKWQVIGFIVGREVYRKDQELIEKIPGGGWSAGWKPLDLSAEHLPQAMSVQDVLRTALNSWAGNDAVVRLRRSHVEITLAANASEVLNYTVRMELNGTLRKVLTELAEESGVSIVLDRRLQEQAKTPLKATFNNIEGVSVGTILDLLTDMTGLEYVVADRVAYVTDRANAKTFAKRSLQPSLQEQFASADVRSTLAEALATLSRATGVSIVLDRRLEDQGKLRVDARFFNYVCLQSALDILTDMTNTKYITVGGVVYVTSPENAKAFQKAQQKKTKNAPSGVSGLG
jgi:hypothetical protein